MKTRIAASVLMIFCLACTNNKPLSDPERQQITGEVKELTTQIISLAEKADFDSIMMLSYDAPDNLIVTPDGKTVTFKEWAEILRNIFGSIESQKINTIAENYMVLDRTTVWYTNVSRTQVNFKDSSILRQDPWSMFILAKKIDNAWKLAAILEYGHEEIAKPAPLPKDLDQIELSKQMLGVWRAEYEDTVLTIDHQPFGKAQIASLKTTVKGKPYGEGRQLCCFDRKNNRLTIVTTGKSGMGGVASLKFNTPTTYTRIPYNNISNPAYAPFRIEGEFTDPNTYVEKIVINNETVKTYISKRIK